MFKGFQCVTVLIEVPVFAFIEEKGTSEMGLPTDKLTDDPAETTHSFDGLWSVRSVLSLWTNMVFRGVVGKTWSSCIMKLNLSS